MKLKRLIAFGLAALMCLGLCACGEKTPAASSASVSASQPVGTILLPEEMPPYFTFASGVGAWGTELSLAPDGSFTGLFSDSDMGDTGEDYPNGTVYHCSFSGQFKDIRQENEYTYSMNLSELVLEEEEDRIRIDKEAGIRYISSIPYGVSRPGSAYRLYLPTAPVSELSEDFLSWWPLRYDQEEENRKVLTCWGLLNVEEGLGFFFYDDDFEFTVPIPEELAALLTVDRLGDEADNAHHKTLIRVSETASIEAGEKQHPGEDWGDGWLFSIAKLDQVGLEKYLAYDDSGFDFFAASADGEAYYLREHATDVRLNRNSNEEFNQAMSQWGMLSEWADRITDDILATNPNLVPFDPEEYLGGEYRYPGEHRIAIYEDPNDTSGGNAMVYLSQPVGSGEGKIWCVERVDYLFTPDGEIYSIPVFPASMGHEIPAAEYYDQTQAECDAGQHPELLTPEGALEEFVRTSESWLYDPDDMSLFRFADPVG